MKGSVILIAVLLSMSGLVAFALWPSQADVERTGENLERRLVLIDQALAQASKNLADIARVKLAVNLRKTLDMQRQLTSQARADEKALLAAYAASPTAAAKADTLAGLQKLGESLGTIAVDSEDLRVRTEVIRSFLERIEPLRAETRELRRTLAAVEAKSEDQDLIRRIRAAIDASSKAEDLIGKALERLPGNLGEGKVLAGTAENEMKAAIEEMKKLKS